MDGGDSESSQASLSLTDVGSASSASATNLDDSFSSVDGQASLLMLSRAAARSCAASPRAQLTDELDELEDAVLRRQQMLDQPDSLLAAAAGGGATTTREEILDQVKALKKRRSELLKSYWKVFFRSDYGVAAPAPPAPPPPPPQLRAMATAKPPPPQSRPNPRFDARLLMTSPSTQMGIEALALFASSRRAAGEGGGGGDDEDFDEEEDEDDDDDDEHSPPQLHGQRARRGASAAGKKARKTSANLHDKENDKDEAAAAAAAGKRPRGRPRKPVDDPTAPASPSRGRASAALDPEQFEAEKAKALARKRARLLASPSRASASGAAATTTTIFTAANDAPTRCNCKKSRCLKLYCECFAARRLCAGDCKCVECENHSENSEARTQAIQTLLMRRPDAFQVKTVIPVMASGDLAVLAPCGGGAETADENVVAAAPAASGAVAVAGVLSHARGCTCRKSFCSKKYCVCWANGARCGAMCRCLNCLNTDSPVASPAPSTLEMAAAAAAAAGPLSSQLEAE